MLILFDNGTPRGLASFLTGHSVEEARTRGWEELSNGELIDVAEQAGLRHQWRVVFSITFLNWNGVLVTSVPARFAFR